MLTDAALRKLKPSEKRRMMRDSEGLYLEIMPTGRKSWKFRISIDGKAVKKTIGTYPDIGLKKARLKRDELRLVLKKEGIPDGNSSFQALADEWFDRQVEPVRTHGHARTIRSRLDRLILPYIGNKKPNDITAPELLRVFKRIEDRGHIESAHRVAQIVSQVFRYGIATGRAEQDISAGLRGALRPRNTKHYPTITEPSKIGALMRAIDGFSGSVIVRCAMKLQAYTAVRPGELRKAEWSEFDIEKAEWRIPAEKMKKRRLHLVPLSKQALDVLRELKPITGECRYLFPSLRTQHKPISDATVNAALRRMGYSQDEFTGHGFRAMFSTIANEHQWPSDVIERQLAHVEGNSVRAAYNHAELIDQRRDLMRWWGEWLCSSKF